MVWEDSLLSSRRLVQWLEEGRVLPCEISTSDTWKYLAGRGYVCSERQSQFSSLNSARTHFLETGLCLSGICNCQLHPYMRCKTPSVFLEHLRSPLHLVFLLSPRSLLLWRRLRAPLGPMGPWWTVVPSGFPSFQSFSDPVPSTALSSTVCVAGHTSQISFC